MSHEPKEGCGRKLRHKLEPFTAFVPFKKLLVRTVTAGGGFEVNILLVAKWGSRHTSEDSLILRHCRKDIELGIQRHYQCHMTAVSSRDQQCTKQICLATAAEQTL